VTTEAAAPAGREGLGRRPHLKRAWELTQGAFDRLLAQLDPDAQKAGEKYKTVHRSLSKFFECRGCASSDELADETLNRVARRLEDGETVYAADFAGYAYGVARNVLRERARGPEPRTRPLETLLPPSHPRLSPSEEEEAALARESAERRLACLEECAEALPAEARELILSYYEGGAGERIAGRKRLAGRLGVPLSNLRIRAHRIRERLEKCVGACLGAARG
jgi:RNA polymerase sigma factor (sigma-70 family)